jgi:hypothetical protein
MAKKGGLFYCLARPAAGLWIAALAPSRQTFISAVPQTVAITGLSKP